MGGLRKEGEMANWLGESKKGAREISLVGGGVASKGGCRGRWLGTRDEVEAEMVPGK